MIKVKKLRRRKGKTDYRRRVELLKSGKPRIVFRKTNKYIIGQFVMSKEAKDIVTEGLTSKNLLKYGWPKENIGSLKSLGAAYLTGYLLGKRVLDKEEKAEGILDIGLNTSVKKSKIYAFLKGVKEAGVKIECDEKLFPDEKRIMESGKMKKADIFKKIKGEIDKKLA
ncbi:50S ribosomal protein L18 [Candidatus Pacearchaeota archaeon]|nr:50S ribosomal protein L18 [Candidatus Pacearchaeota archaeon]